MNTSHSARAVSFVCLVAAAVSAFAFGQPASDRAERFAFAPKSSPAGPLGSRIDVTNARPSTGSLVDVQIDHAITGPEGRSLYNPFFNRLLTQPAALAVFDQNGHFIRDLLGSREGSHRTPQREDWVALPPSGRVGCTVRVLMDLQPGRYRVQAIYYADFVSDPPRDGDEAQFRLFERNFRRDELLRSNSVLIEVIREP